MKLKLGESIPVPTAAYETLKIGLGWNTGDEGIDIDANILMFDKDNKLYENINFNNLKSKCGAIEH